MASTAFRGFGARTAEARETNRSVWGNKKRKGSPKVKPEGFTRRCRECKDRWAKIGDVCDDCRSRRLTDNRETQARHARERAERQAELVRKVEVPRQTRTILVEGREFEVVWDGRV